MYKTIFILLLFFTTSYSKTIITVTYPIQEFFIKKIADNKLHIRTIYDDSGKFDSSNKKSLDRFLNGDYYFTFGLEEEKQLSNLLSFKNKSLETIDMTDNIGLLKLPNGHKNPYIWMDPILVRTLAKNIYEKLVEISVYNKVDFKRNYEVFLSEIDNIYLDLKKRVDNSDLYGFYVFNNELDYFAKRYRINIYHKENRRLHISEVSQTIRFSKKENISHIVIPKGSDYSIAQSYSSNINGKIVEVDIYDKSWKVNLFALVRGVTNF